MILCDSVEHINKMVTVLVRPEVLLQDFGLSR